MPVLSDPLPPAQARSLRRLVLDLRDREPRRLFAPMLHVGDPDGPRVGYGIRADEDLDDALRVDVVAALLVRTRARVPAPLVWLTRPGDLAWRDADADWVRATTAAYAEARESCTFVVVTREGWVDPRSGLVRRWKRLRDRRRPRPSTPP